MQDGVAATRLSLTEIPSDTLRRMHDYWQGKCRGEQLPGRQDIDPLDFPWALGLVCLLDVERYPLVFRYRLDGTTIAERYGADLTGRTTDAIKPEFHARARTAAWPRARPTPGSRSRRPPRRGRRESCA